MFWQKIGENVSRRTQAFNDRLKILKIKIQKPRRVNTCNTIEQKKAKTKYHLRRVQYNKERRNKAENKLWGNTGGGSGEWHQTNWQGHDGARRLYTHKGWLTYKTQVNTFTQRGGGSKTRHMGVKLKSKTGNHRITNRIMTDHPVPANWAAVEWLSASKLRSGVGMITAGKSVHRKWTNWKSRRKHKNHSPDKGIPLRIFLSSSVICFCSLKIFLVF